MSLGGGQQEEAWHQVPQAGRSYEGTQNPPAVARPQQGECREDRDPSAQGSLGAPPPRTLQQEGRGRQLRAGSGAVGAAPRRLGLYSSLPQQG